MSEQHIILIESPCSLSIELDCLRIVRESEPPVRVLPADIAVLCLHHHSIRLSVHVLRHLTAANAVVLVTDDRHHPSGLMMPVFGRPQAVIRLRQQLALWESDLARRLWQQLVATRLQSQSAVLEKLGRRSAARLARLASLVEPGDAGHLEGQGARLYWDDLFSARFTRHKKGATDPVNGRLNFGYALLRSLIARELAIAALRPELGVGHKSTENPFNLADDFLEAYRYLVEDIVTTDEEAALSEFTPHSRKTLLTELFQQSVRLRGKDFRLTAAIRRTIGSYTHILDEGGRGKRPQLALPEFTG